MGNSMEKILPYEKDHGNLHGLSSKEPTPSVKKTMENPMEMKRRYSMDFPMVF